MSLQVETAEALASALYQMPFTEFLGEDDREGEHLMWFHVGQRPKDMRVTIVRPLPGAVIDPNLPALGKADDIVRVRVEWRNYAEDARNPLKCEQTLTISCYAATQAMLGGPTEDAILRVLAIYSDVLAESGVAGKEPLASHGVNPEAE